MKRRPPSFWELLVEATTDTRRGYDLLAPRFELTPYATPVEMIQACRSRVDSLFPLQPAGSRAADLACGTGRASKVLRTSCTMVDGFDFSSGMLAEAKAATGSVRGFTFHQADLATLCLPPGSYDRVATFGAWGHILPPWRQHLVKQVLEALKPDGVFYTITADPATPWNAGWWRAALFDTAIRTRNWLLGDPFHMYYLLNDTLTVKRLFEESGPCQVRLEPIPRFPHPRLTLLMVSRSQEARR